MKNLRIQPERDIAQVEREEPFTFSFEEQPVTAYPGETIGAALIAAGILTFRTTRKAGKPRGIFCGIGVCFDCLLVVNGRPNVRACMTPARPNMLVKVQVGAGERCYEN
ncbi:(2Fe-2S)-binding protein [Ktedonosporobacter rubrisoli]|uniref:(2Fe-2S)-binding protein n=1 Tax=Ktedonosporobacter rubrisoli TaxID=2509675 RepID=A0A4P6K2Z2_KTERU|nr:(2Fe-2S)-binding protein [Ktedonosporobacter rubrisoli]QBD82529.1 (2Fe-2S)-binding protein [Ktedonosporobacter rubrisoli]